MGGHHQASGRACGPSQRRDLQDIYHHPSSSTYLDPISHTQEFFNAPYALIANLADVQKPHDAITKVHEGAVWSQALHDSLG